MTLIKNYNPPVAFLARRLYELKYNAWSRIHDMGSVVGIIKARRFIFARGPPKLLQQWKLHAGTTWKRKGFNAGSHLGICHIENRDHAL